MLWFKVGLFTFMKIDSLMVLACPWSSLPIMLMLVSVMVCPVLLYVCLDGRRVSEVLLASFPKGPCCSLYVFLIAGYVVALVAVDNPALLIPGVLVLKLHQCLFYCSVALEVYLDTISTTDVFETFGSFNKFINTLKKEREQRESQKKVTHG